jgi:2-amino-4-hydroxy-6-hydroxymethyldihydropteridine diphosphokinase
MSTAYLGLGSNIDARHNIRSAIAHLRETFTSVDLSPVYQATAYGFNGNDFINLVARIETPLTPLELKAFLTELENQHKRDRRAPKYGDRTLDIDILLYDDLYLLSPALEIPRNEILEAAYVLQPMADLAPDLNHPACGKTFSELWNNFPQDDMVLTSIEL